MHRLRHDAKDHQLAIALLLCALGVVGWRREECLHRDVDAALQVLRLVNRREGAGGNRPERLEAKGRNLLAKIARDGLVGVALGRCFRLAGCR